MTEQRFEQGVDQVCHGVHLAFAIPLVGRPPRQPDRDHWWVKGVEGWQILNVAAIADLHHVIRPLELTHDYYRHSYLAQMRAAGWTFARLATLGVPGLPPLRLPAV